MVRGSECDQPGVFAEEDAEVADVGAIGSADSPQHEHNYGLGASRNLTSRP